MVDLSGDRALLSISVTSELTGVNPQMLRVYEQKGLVDPARTQGGTRRYSGDDLDQINEITTLLSAGLNLIGVEHVFALRSETRRLHAKIEDLQQQARAQTGDDPPLRHPSPSPPQ